jgi:hypothetical protein
MVPTTPNTLPIDRFFEGAGSDIGPVPFIIPILFVVACMPLIDFAIIIRARLAGAAVFARKP